MLLNEQYISYNDHRMIYLLKQYRKQNELLKKLIKNDVQQKYILQELQFIQELQQLQQKKITNKCFQQRNFTRELKLFQQENLELISYYKKHQHKNINKYIIILIIFFLIFLYIVN